MLRVELSVEFDLPFMIWYLVSGILYLPTADCRLSTILLFYPELEYGGAIELFIRM